LYQHTLQSRWVRRTEDKCPKTFFLMCIFISVYSLYTGMTPWSHTCIYCTLIRFASSVALSFPLPLFFNSFQWVSLCHNVFPHPCPRPPPQTFFINLSSPLMSWCGKSRPHSWHHQARLTYFLQLIFQSLVKIKMKTWTQTCFSITPATQHDPNCWPMNNSWIEQSSEIHTQKLSHLVKSKRIKS
jgi:hypothetical protein